MSAADVLIPQSQAANLVDPTAYADGRIHETYAWLRANAYSNRVLKWDTEAWGENPADFGRK